MSVAGVGNGFRHFSVCARFLFVVVVARNEVSGCQLKQESKSNLMGNL